MRIFVDITEPGMLVHHLAMKGNACGIRVERTILHKRGGLGAPAREKHPFYGLGGDYLICDDELNVACAIEQKSFDDLAKAITLDGDPARRPRLFRQVTDLVAHPLPILLLEGPPSPLYRRIEPVALGFQFWAARQGVSILTSASPLGSAQAILCIARKLAQELEGRSAPAPPEDPDERPAGPP